MTILGEMKRACKLQTENVTKLNENAHHINHARISPFCSKAVTDVTS